MSNGIYLGKNGRPFGPYTDSEVEALQANGEWNEFHWIWDDAGRTWQPLDPPPPPIITKAGITKAGVTRAQPLPAKAPPAPQPPAPVAAPVYTLPTPPPVQATAPQPQFETPAPVIPLERSSAKKFPERTYQAVCHNHQNIVSGELYQRAEHDGELVTEDESSSPQLPVGIPLHLNLLEERTKKAYTITASVSSVRRHPHGWIYGLHWDHDLRSETQRRSAAKTG
jgi:hypothetical protein